MKNAKMTPLMPSPFMWGGHERKISTEKIKLRKSMQKRRNGCQVKKFSLTIIGEEKLINGRLRPEKKEANSKK